MSELFVAKEHDNGPRMLRATSIVTAVGVLVQIIGFVRTSIIAAAFGASLEVDAYNLGLLAPAFVGSVIVGWLQMSFVGRYASLMAKREAELAAIYRTSMLGLLGVMTVSCAAILSLQPVYTMAVLLPTGRTELLLTSAAALQISAWTLPFVVVGDFLSLVLNSHGRFFAAAMAPFVSVVISVVALLHWPTFTLGSLVWTLLLGNSAQALVIVVALARLKLFWRFETRAAAREVGACLRLAPSLMAGSILANAAVAMIPVYSAQLGDGAVAVYSYAARLHSALSQVLVVGLATVLLPRLATLWAQDNKSEIKELYRRLARGAVLITGYLYIGVLLMGDAAVVALLGHGRLDSAAANDVAQVWMILSLSLFPLSYGTFVAKLGSALRRSSVILVSGVVLLAVTWATAHVGARSSSLLWISAGAVVSSACTCVLWLMWLSREVRTRSILVDIAMAALRTVVILSPAAAVERAINYVASDLTSIVSCGLRGLGYTGAVLLMLAGTKWYRWFASARCS